MEFDFTWVLLGFPIAFTLGWLASRLDLRQLRIENRQAPKAYFRGLNFLLNEQQDQAIDAFIEAVQGDPDTTELHFALGNLFRRRGEYERAVRVHEHLLARADLSRKDRDRAQHALALDFLKAGLLDRAEAALHKLEGSAFEGEALLALLAIYERSRDWPQAKRIAQRLDDAEQGSFTTRLAHYLCEEDEQAQRDGNTTQPLPLVAHALAELAVQTGRQAEALTLLQSFNSRAPSIDVTEAMVSLSGGPEEARSRYLDHLGREASLVMATQWLAGEKLSDDVAQARVQAALEQASAPLKRYRCAACGFEARQHFWQCPGCQAWDSYPARRVEEL